MSAGGLAKRAEYDQPRISRILSSTAINVTVSLMWSTTPSLSVVLATHPVELTVGNTVRSSGGYNANVTGGT